MQLSILTKNLKISMTAHNGVDTVVHVTKSDENSWIVRHGQLTLQFYTPEHSKTEWRMHNVEVKEGLSRFYFYADQLVQLGVLVKDGTTYSLNPTLKDTINSLEFLGEKYECPN